MMEPRPAPAMDSAVRLILRAEGTAVFAASIYAYSIRGTGWLLFVVLILVPDISFAGYLAGPRVGAMVYNTMHSYVLPLTLAVLGLAVPYPLVVAIAIVWVAHIGFDRMLGYGLKLPQGFSETHLGRIGKRPAAE